MPLKFHTSSLKEYLKTRDYKDYLIIVPGIFQENDIESRFLYESADKCIQGGKILRLEDFVYRLLFSSSHSIDTISKTLQREIVRYSLLIAKKRKELKYFQSVYAKEGLIDEMQNTLTSLKQAKIRPEDLSMCVSSSRNKWLKTKVNDLQIVYQYYEDFLDQRSWYDKERAYELLLGDLRNLTKLDCYKELLQRDILFTEFNELSGMDMDFINELAKFCNIEFLIEGTVPYTKYFLEASNEKLQGEVNIDNGILIKAFSPEEEIEEIAYYIIDKTVGKNNFSDFTIVLKNKTKYEPLIERIFQKYNIPLKAVFNKPLKNFPVISRLFNILKKVVYDCVESSDLDVYKNFCSVLDEKKTSISVELGTRKHFVNSFKAYNKFLELVKECESVIKSMDTIFSYTYYFEIFLTLLKNASVEYCINYETGVEIVDFRYSASVNNKYVLLPEMLDGTYPTQKRTEVILDSNITHLLKEVHGYPVIVHDEREQIEKNIFRLLTSKKGTNYIFSIPLNSQHKGDAIESSLLAGVSKTYYYSYKETHYFKEINNQSVLLNDEKIVLKNPPDSFSPTSIEQYVECPYKYFVNKILRLEETLEETLDLLAKEKGTLLHAVLEEFYKQHNGFMLINKNPQEAQKKILEVLNYNFNKIISQKKKYFLLLKKHIEKKLIKFIQKESQEQVFINGLEPAYFEKVIEHNDKKAGVRFKAIIDRVDIDRKNKNFAIVDYKLKSTDLRGIADIRAGKKFQLPIYINLFNKLQDYNSYSLKYAYFYKIFDLNKDEGVFVESNPFGSTKRSKNIVTKGDLEALIKKSLDLAYSQIKRIKEGYFPVEPVNKKACEYCQWEAICRKQ